MLRSGIHTAVAGGGAAAAQVRRWRGGVEAGKGNPDGGDVKIPKVIATIMLTTAIEVPSTVATEVPIVGGAAVEVLSSDGWSTHADRNFM